MKTKHLLLPLAMIFASAVYATDITDMTEISVSDGETFTADSGEATLTSALAIGAGSTFNLDGASVSITSGTMTIGDGGAFKMSGGSYVTSDSTAFSATDATIEISGGYYNSGAGITLSGSSSFDVTDAGSANTYASTGYHTWVYTGTMNFNTGTSLNISSSEGNDVYYSAYAINVYGGASVNINGSGGYAMTASGNKCKTTLYSGEEETAKFLVTAKDGDFSVAFGMLSANSESATGKGSVIISLTGASSDEKVVATATKAMTLGNGSAGTVDFSLNGYASLTASSTVAMYSGTTFSLNNTNNTATFGGAVTMYDGSTLKITGSENTVSFTSSIDFQSGATICFVSDSSGFSAVDLASITTMEGIIEIYLTDIDWTDGAEVAYALFTSDDIDFEDAGTFDDLSIVVSGEENVDVTTGYWTDASGNSVWGVTSIVTAAVPEPSTYAMLFGLAALAFAYYRRRK